VIVSAHSAGRMFNLDTRAAAASARLYQDDAMIGVLLLRSSIYSAGKGVHINEVVVA
jgi:hypothetical protein